MPVYSTNLSDAPIKHGFFGRKGGVSSAIYSSLNCGYGSNDTIENVDKNRALIAQYFDIPPKQLINPYQIHSTKCNYIDCAPQSVPQVDAYVTDVPLLAIGILTADCAPILFYDPVARVIGAAHAGWQGALYGVIEATIECMLGRGANSQNIIATIGPCIGQKSYEVGIEYQERFISIDPQSARYFATKGNEGEKFLFDLKGYCQQRLIAGGVKNIEVLEHDTCALEQDFFSNRRRTILNEPDYGRNLSAIML